MTPVPAWRWVLGVVGLLVAVAGAALAFVPFAGGGGAAGLFGPCVLANFGLLAVYVAKEGAL